MNDQQFILTLLAMLLGALLVFEHCTPIQPEPPKTNRVEFGSSKQRYSTNQSPVWSESGTISNVFTLDRNSMDWTNSDGFRVANSRWTVSGTNLVPIPLHSVYDIGFQANDPRTIYLKGLQLRRLGEGIWGVSVDVNSATIFTIRARNTNVFITTTNEVTGETFWGPDDKYEVHFYSPTK